MVKKGLNIAHSHVVIYRYRMFYQQKGCLNKGVAGYSKINGIGIGALRLFLIILSDCGGSFLRNVMTFRKVGFIFGCVLLVLAGCSSNQPAVNSPAVQALENYLKALADKNETAYSQLICPDWEMDAFLEFDAYQGVKTSLSELSCRQTGEQDSFTLVTCQGMLTLSYGNEIQELDLSNRIYRLSLKNEVWQVCGFSTTDH